MKFFLGFVRPLKKIRSSGPPQTLDDYATLKRRLGEARERAEVAKDDEFSLFHTLDAMYDTMAVLDEKLPDFYVKTKYGPYHKVEPVTTIETVEPTQVEPVAVSDNSEMIDLVADDIINDTSVDASLMDIMFENTSTECY